MTGQRLAFFAEKIETFKRVETALVCPEHPTRLYTMIGHYDLDSPPQLPISSGTRMVWQEAEGHDWSWRDGRLHYASGTAGGHVWLLLEYDVDEEPAP